MISHDTPSCFEQVRSSLGVQLRVAMQIGSVFLDIRSGLVDGEWMSPKRRDDLCGLYALLFRSTIKRSICIEQANATQEQQDSIFGLHLVDVQTSCFAMHDLRVGGEQDMASWCGWEIFMH